MKSWSLFSQGNVTTGNKITKYHNCGKEQFLLFSTIFSIYLQLQESNYTIICEMWLFDLFFLNSANLIYQCTDISNNFRESFGFEITRVDCTYVSMLFSLGDPYEDRTIIFTENLHDCGISWVSLLICFQWLQHLTLSGSNHPCPETFSMVLRMFRSSTVLCFRFNTMTL